MPVGLQVWDETGLLIFSTNTTTVRLFGILNIGGAGSPQSGSLVDGRFYEGVPFVFTQMERGFNYEGWDPIASVSGQTLTWAYPRGGDSAPERQNAHILYGVRNG